VDIDEPVLRELKRMRRQEGQSLGRLVSDLLAEALASRRSGLVAEEAPFEWVSRPMGARVDLTDKEALHRLLDEEEGKGRP